MTTAAETPTLSIVVAAFNGGSYLVRCLDSIARDAGPCPVETLVVSGSQALDHVTAHPHAVHLRIRPIQAPRESTVPRLRALGIASSRGRIVALLEDDCEVQAGWRDAVCSAHQSGASVVGGAVEPGSFRRARDWAVFFCDHGRFMLPFGGGEALALPGNNLSCTRTALALLSDEDRSAFVETPAFERWRQSGVTLRLEPRMVVRNMHRWGVTDLTRTPFHHGRAYGAWRMAGQPWWRRLAMSLRLVLLPALKTGRVIVEGLSRRRYRWQLVAALPWIILWTTWWSWGECTGYLAGPGDSPGRWR